MRIGILAGCLGRRDGGPETYERELIRAIARAAPVHEYRIYVFEDGARACLGPLPDHVVVRVLRPRSRWISLGLSLPLAMLRDRIDVLHAALYPPPLCPVPLVFTMHDVSPIARPDFFAPRVWRRLNPLVRAGLRRAKIVICVSRDAMTTTAAITGTPQSRMRVVPHGVDPQFRPTAIDPDALEVLGATAPYVLYVGKIMARKNVTTLIEAYARFVAETGSDMPLVLAGKRLYDTADVDETIARLGLGARVIELGHVPDAALPALYAGATMFVYVTLWEGFGLPVLEAMASGTPVIASNLSSIPEVAGDAAILVDPTDSAAIAHAMGRIVADPALRTAMTQAGRARAAQFTWADTARETVRSYEAAAPQAARRSPGHAALLVKRYD